MEQQIIREIEKGAIRCFSRKSGEYISISGCLDTRITQYQFRRGEGPRSEEIEFVKKHNEKLLIDDLIKNNDLIEHSCFPELGGGIKVSSCFSYIKLPELQEIQLELDEFRSKYFISEEKIKELKLEVEKYKKIDEHYHLQSNSRFLELLIFSIICCTMVLISILAK